MRGVVLLAAAMMMSPGPARGQGSASTCPDDRAWTGKYRNYSYGFSIKIPEKLKGFWNSPRCSQDGTECICMSDHGRVIPLAGEADRPERQIEVYAGYAAYLDRPTLKQVVDFKVNSIREGAAPDSAGVPARSATRLGGLPAERVYMRYRDKETKQWVVEDLVASLRNGVEYLIDLRTSDGRYQSDRAALNELVSTFAFTK